MGKRERLDKVISNMGYGSRKEVKKFIKEGRVAVNDMIVRDRSKKINPYKDLITFDGKKVEYREYIYLMMNKPKGVVSSTYDLVHKTVLDLIEEKYLIFNPFPVGRLDKDTEGLLILTNDGKLAHEILSPKKKVPKTYYAEVEGLVGEEVIDLFKAGIVLDDGYKTMAAGLEIIEEDSISSVLLTIKEGKFHQIKRMFQAVDMRVVYLKRIFMGGLYLDDRLSLGEYRELEEKELNILYNL